MARCKAEQLYEVFHWLLATVFQCRRVDIDNKNVVGVSWDAGDLPVSRFTMKACLG
jgi:hypothetical protein